MSTLALALLLGACGGEGERADRGSVSVRAYGESFIEDGIPGDAVDDGWFIEFASFEVTLTDITVAGVAARDARVIELSTSSNGQGHEVGTISVEVGEHARPSFTIASVELSGSAMKDGTIKSFSWGFDSATRYRDCATTTSVVKDTTATLQITIHADHLFFDSLVAEEPQLLFQPLADADADGDGTVTEDELATTDIGAYDPGNEDIDDLWSFLSAQSRTLGHVDGEGHCEAFAAD